LSTSSGDVLELGVLSGVEVYFSAKEEDEGKKEESAAEKRGGKWRRSFRMDLTERGAEDGHIYTRMLLAPRFLEEGDEER
jgi:hypothetical protein